MGYSTTTPINNEISQTNSILQHTSVIAEYSDSVIDSTLRTPSDECYVD